MLRSHRAEARMPGLGEATDVQRELWNATEAAFAVTD